MKLLQIVESTLAGVGRHVIDLSEGLLERGHEVHIIYSNSRSDQTFRGGLCRLNGCTGFRAVYVPMQRKPGISDLAAIRTVRRYLLHHGPFDAVHCHSTKAGVLGRIAAAGQLVKRIYTPHGFFSMDPTRTAVTRWFAAGLEAILSRLCDRIVVLSFEEQAHALEIGITASQLVLIPNGVAVKWPSLPPGERERIRTEWGLSEADVCIGFVGRLVPVKSPETMLDSFARFQRRSRARAKLVVVGSGPLDASLRKHAADLKIEANVIWTGAQDASALMCAFDILAITSCSEATPLVALEALAQGLPIVATSVGFIPVAVKPGVNGFIVPIRGVEEISAALDILAANPELRLKMGQASRVLSRNFSLNSTVDRTMALYEQCGAGMLTDGPSRDWESAALQ